MNNLVLVCRLTRDPELKYIPGSGTAVTSMSVAVDREFSKEKTADFFNVKVFGKSAENCCNYLEKGSQVAIKGRIQNNNYEKDGVMHYGMEVIADRVEFLSKSEKKAESSSLFDDVDDDEITF